MWWCVTSAGEHKVRIILHLLQQVHNDLTHLLCCSILEHRHRVDVSHCQCRWRHLFDHLLHLAFIAKMVSSSTCSHHRLRTMSCVATIMQYHDKVVILHLVYNLFHILRRERLAVVIRHQTSRRLSHHHAISTRLFQCHTVFRYEVRTLLQQCMCRIRIFIDQHHDFRHVIQSACQREWTNTATKQRTVFYLFCG